MNNNFREEKEKEKVAQFFLAVHSEKIDSLNDQ